MKNILVIFGGCSSEYGVSLQSAAGVLNAMDREKYTPVMLGITRDGAWYHYTGSLEDISADRWLQAGRCTPVLLLPKREGRRLMLRRGDRLEEIGIDAADVCAVSCRLSQNFSSGSFMRRAQASMMRPFA